MTPGMNIAVNLLGLAALSFAPIAIMSIGRYFVRRAAMRHRPGGQDS